MYVGPMINAAIGRWEFELDRENESLYMYKGAYACHDLTLTEQTKASVDRHTHNAKCENKELVS